MLVLNVTLSPLFLMMDRSISRVVVSLTYVRFLSLFRMLFNHCCICLYAAFDLCLQILKLYGINFKLELET